MQLQQRKREVCLILARSAEIRQRSCQADWRCVTVETLTLPPTLARYNSHRVLRAAVGWYYSHVRLINKLGELWRGERRGGRSLLSAHTICKRERVLAGEKKGRSAARDFFACNCNIRAELSLNNLIASTGEKKRCIYHYSEGIDYRKIREQYSLFIELKSWLYFDRKTVVLKKKRVGIAKNITFDQLTNFIVVDWNYTTQ